MNSKSVEYLPPSDEARSPAVLSPESGLSQGWVKMMRGSEPLEVIKHNPLAFILAAVIAFRARWRQGFHAYNLAQGEARIGDYENYGMTQQQYRTAKAQLNRWGFATFRATNKGTIGKLTDNRLFSIFGSKANDESNGPPTQQPTDGQRTANEQQTSNEERKKGKDNKRAREAIDYSSRFFKNDSPTTDPRPDWHGLSMEQKLYAVLGRDEMARCHIRWLKRANEQPDRLARLLDMIHCELLEGKIIKSRGGYAEDLWKWLP